MSPQRLVVFGLGLFFVLVSLGSLNNRSANAQGGVQLTVNTLADTTGTCSQNGNGTCSLRDLLTFVSTSGGTSPVIITFSVSGFLNLTANLPSIKSNMTIDGSGQQLTISGQGAYRIFNVTKKATATIKALTMANGSGATDCGSADSCGGAIKNRGTLTVSNSVFSGNYAYFLGGAINNGGLLNITNTTFDNNTTSDLTGFGGAIFSNGPLTISNQSSFNGNTAFNGGALYVSVSPISISGTTFTSNSADEGAAIYSLTKLNINDSNFNNNELGQATAGTHGGAIYNKGGNLIVNNTSFANNSTAPFGYGGAISSSGTLSVKNSTISGNYAEYGGGVYNLDGTATISKSTFVSNTGWGDGGGMYNDHGTLIVTNSTLTANTAEGANGGGIYNFDGALYVTNSTVYGNHSASIIHYAGGIYNDGTSVTLRNTVVANNSANQCYDYADSLTADAYNIDDDGTCGNATQKTVADIALLALANNGGPTQTMKPAAKSVLRNAGDDAVCADPVGPSDYGAGGKDQRGVTRPQGPHCDVGAYEAKAN